jgi:hypothetical protein
MYNYETHHAYLAAFLSADFWLITNGADWLLTLQLGRVSDALPIMEERLHVLEKVVSDTSSPSRNQELPQTASNLLVCYHMHGQTQLLRNTIDVLGFTFDTLSEWLSELASHVRMFTSMEQKGVGEGISVLPIKRIYWQIKSFLIMHTDVPRSKAIAWLQALPDDEDFYQYSMIVPGFDYGALFGTMLGCFCA